MKEIKILNFDMLEKLLDVYKRQPDKEWKEDYFIPRLAIIEKACAI